MKLVTNYLHHSTLHSVLAPLAVNNRDLAVEEVIEDVDWLSWTHVAEEIGAWCSDRQSAFLYQRPSVWVLRCSDSDKTSLSCHHHRQKVEIGLQNDSERSRPKLFGQYFKYLALSIVHDDQLLSLFRIEDVDNDGIGERPFLGLINTLQCLFIICISSQSVYSFSRKRD